MNLWKQYFYNPLCLSCGSFFTRQHLYCDDCFKNKISHRVELKNRKINQTLDAFYLFDWVPFESDMLSEMVYRMKSDKCLQAWKFYAELAAEQMTDHADIKNIDYIVPIPGSKTYSNHAQIFAEILGVLLKKPILNILEKASFQGEQKRRNKIDRLYKTIQLREQFTTHLQHLNLNKSNVLVVDDILTTGSSFNQAIQALGPSKKVTLLTLFYRTANSNTILVS